ncbi:MAG: divergent PAP2 family protein [Lachnospiraceae bacterium]|nr:divergent PAP2 family protein [Lachnospiraceae bacterium]MBP5184433.1 divergent PAP2 family protein [Lachnospiraceae bacterium]
MRQFIQGLLLNRPFLAAATGWAVAQLIKSVLYIIMNKEFKFERLFGAGGMPSSHSATVCAFVVVTYTEYGSASFQFAVAMLLAIIVIYDARGVRYETSKQAIVLNKLIEDIMTEDDPDLVLPKLKELVGHSPLQVFVGGLIGLLIGALFSIFAY